MRKVKTWTAVLFAAATSLLVSVGCGAGDGYKIVGFHDGGPGDAVVYLLELEDGNVADTLAVTRPLNGRYEFSGMAGASRSCRLRVENEFRGTVLGTADFTLGNDGLVVYTGTDGRLRVLADEGETRLGEAFLQNASRFAERKRTLLEKYVAADEEGKDSLALEFEALIADREAEESRLVGENPESFSAACAVSTELTAYVNRLKQYDYSLGNRVNGALGELSGWEEFERRYALLSGERKEWLESVGFGERYRVTRERMKQSRLALATSTGNLAPDMELAFKSGKEVRLHAIPGKLKIVDFWASWCGPCRASNPFLLELYGKFKDKGLEVVSVSVDVDEAAWLKAVREDKLTWTYNVRDLKGQAANLYGVTLIPCVLLLDEDNRILGRNLPKEELRRIVEEKLN